MRKVIQKSQQNIAIGFSLIFFVLTPLSIFLFLWVCGLLGYDVMALMKTRSFFLLSCLVTSLPVGFYSLFFIKESFKVHYLDHTTKRFFEYRQTIIRLPSRTYVNKSLFVAHLRDAEDVSLRFDILGPHIRILFLIMGKPIKKKIYFPEDKYEVANEIIDLVNEDRKELENNTKLSHTT